jgi:hypothetical protein
LFLLFFPLIFLFFFQAALDWVLGTQNIPLNKIIAHGLSIGGAIACALADANPGLHLVLDQTFSSASATAHHIAQTKVWLLCLLISIDILSYYTPCLLFVLFLFHTDTIFYLSLLFEKLCTFSMFLTKLK